MFHEVRVSFLDRDLHLTYIALLFRWIRRVPTKGPVALKRSPPTLYHVQNELDVFVGIVLVVKGGFLGGRVIIIADPLLIIYDDLPLYPQYF